MLQQPFLQVFWVHLLACLTIFSRPLRILVENLLFPRLLHRISARYSMMNQPLPGIFQRSQNIHVYIYKMNILVDLGCWIMHGLLNHAWGDYFKLAKWTHLTLSSYPKTSDVIEMVFIPTWVYPLFKFWLDICRIVSSSIYRGNLGTPWIWSFPHQQTWTVLQWKIYCCPHIWNKCTTSFQGLPLAFQAVL